MTPTPDPLRAALNAVVTKTTWRPDNTVLIHDGTAWNTLVGRIVMATNGDAQAAPALDVTRLTRIEAAAEALIWDLDHGHPTTAILRAEQRLRAALLNQ